jgi:aminoglycoside N3'-acetyltransferase
MTITEIIDRLDRLPLSGSTVLVDAYLSDATQAAELVSALRAMTGADGTLVMPAFTQERTLSDLSSQPVAFHAELAVDPALGAVPEVFRRQASSLRSSHPTNSFLASGPRAQLLLSTNRDNNPLGPVKKLNLLKGISLRIGQPASLFTPLHLAEQQSLGGLRYRGTAKRINIAGFEERVVIEHLTTCSAGFAAIDETLAVSDPAPSNGVALVPLRDLVRAATTAISSAREQLLCGRTECAACATRRVAIDAAGES